MILYVNQMKIYVIQPKSDVPPKFISSISFSVVLSGLNKNYGSAQFISQPITVVTIMVSIKNFLFLAEM